MTISIENLLTYGPLVILYAIAVLIVPTIWQRYLSMAKRIQTATMEQLFMDYVYNKRFPLIMLHGRQFQEAELQLAWDLRGQILEGASTGYDENEIDRYYRRAVRFVNAVDEGQHQKFNILLWLSWVAFILAIVLPIVVLKSDPFESSHRAGIFAASISALFLFGAAFLGYVGHMVDDKDKPADR